MIVLKNHRATFIGTREEWQEVIGHLAVGYAPDRRIATAIMNGLERVGKKYVKYETQKVQDYEVYFENHYGRKMTYALRFNGGTVDRLREIQKEVASEGRQRVPIAERNWCCDPGNEVRPREGCRCGCCEELRTGK